MRLGLIAPEYPPDLGGMAEMSRGMAVGLSATDEVTVFTFPRDGLPAADFEQQPLLTGNLERDAELLRAQRVDAWLALNAGLVPLARKLESPFFSYFMGNDFLDPWIAYGGPWERIQRPYAARLRHGLRRFAIRRAVPSLRGLFTISRNSAELIEASLGVDRRRLRIHPPGVGDAFFQQRGGEQPGLLRILTVCRLSSYTRRKNVDGVLEAVRLLEPEVPILYTVVGDGDDRPRLEARARDLGIAERVSFRGAVELPELLACYAETDLFILAAKASARDVEGFGIVYLEASAAGVPSLASHGGGATDAVVDGVNGLLIPASSPRDVAKGIESFRRRRADFPPEKVRAFAETFRWAAVAGGVRHAIESQLG